MKKTLKSWLLVGCAAGLALSLHSTAKAQTQNGTVLVTIGSGRDAVVTPLILTLDPQTGTYGLESTTINVLGTQVIVGGSGRFDPVLTYSFSATNNNGIAVPFAADFAIPITPVSAGSTLISSLGFSLTDQSPTNARDGATESPFPIPPFNATAFQTFTGDGIDLGSSVDIGTSASVGTTGSRTGIFNFDGTGVSPIAFSTLDVHISFLLSGGGDNIGITGSVEVVDVPEPGTVAMLAGLGISGSVFALRRKRRA